MQLIQITIRLNMFEIQSTNDFYLEWKLHIFKAFYEKHFVKIFKTLLAQTVWKHLQNRLL